MTSSVASGNRSIRRSSTARTPAGTAESTPALNLFSARSRRTTSAAKNGLPPVRRYSAATAGGSIVSPVASRRAAAEFGRRQPPQYDLPVSGHPGELGRTRLGVPVGTEHQHRRGADVSADGLEQPERRFVRPVQVVQDEHDRSDAMQCRGHVLEEPEPDQIGRSAVVHGKSVRPGPGR